MTEDVYAGQVIRIILKRQNVNDQKRRQQSYACHDEQREIGSVG